MFGCAHKWGFPRRRPPGERTEFDCYQVCVVCGARRLYSWRYVLPGAILPPDAPTHAPAKPASTARVQLCKLRH